MSLDPIWSLSPVSKSEEEQTERAFSAALKAAQSEKCDDRDSDVLDGSVAIPERVFYPTAFADLSAKIVSKGGPIEAAAFGKLGFIMLNRVTAPYVLWQGLGVERAAQLPGWYGNMFIPSTEIEEVQERVESLLRVDRKTFVSSAVIIHSSEVDIDALEILDALPLALAAASKVGKGLLVLNAYSMAGPDEEEANG